MRRSEPHAADGKRQRRYDGRTPDSIAVRGATEAETRRNVSVAAVVSTLHRLGATGVNHRTRVFEGYTRWTFECRMRNGVEHEGNVYTYMCSPEHEGVVLMTAGAACIRAVMEGKVR